jgi:hypothetical protein
LTQLGWVQPFDSKVEITMKKLSLVAIAATLAFAAPVSATETTVNPTVSSQASAGLALGGMTTGATIATLVVVAGVVTAIADSSSGTN